MGLELVFGALSLAVGLVSTASSQAAARRAAAAQAEANNIQLAQSENKSREDKRQLLREERIRRARIMQSSYNTGGAASSGEIGAMGAISTNVDSQVAASRGESKANAGVNLFNQKATDYNNQAQQALAWGEVFQGGLTTFGNIFDK